MSPETEQAIQDLQDQIQTLSDQLGALTNYDTLPLELENALLARGFIKLSSLGGLSGTSVVYVAASSGASPTTAITFVNGIRTL